MTFYSRFNPPPSLPTEVGGESMACQDAARECDINYILARVGAGTYALPPVQPFNVDLTDVPSDYQEMQNRVIAAQEAFYALPSRVRDRFAQNPAALCAWLQDASNRNEAIELGLIPRPTPAPAPAPSDQPVVPAE